MLFPLDTSIPTAFIAYRKWCKRKGYHFSGTKAAELYIGSIGHITTLPKNSNTTSPIFAISCGAVFSPTPYMARTVSYSGSCRARRSISARRTARVGGFHHDLLAL